MNKHLLIVTACMSISYAQTHTLQDPFAQMRKTFKAMDELFEEFEASHNKLLSNQTQQPFTYIDSDDAFVITLHGISDEKDLKAEREENAITITTPTRTTIITAQPNVISIAYSEHAQSAQTKATDQKESKDPLCSQQESWSKSYITIPYKGKITLDQPAKKPGNLSFDKQAGTLTIRLPKEKTSQSLSIQIINNTDENAEKESDLSDNEKDKQ